MELLHRLQDQVQVAVHSELLLLILLDAGYDETGHYRVVLAVQVGNQQFLGQVFQGWLDLLAVLLGLHLLYTLHFLYGLRLVSTGNLLPLERQLTLEFFNVFIVSVDPLHGSVDIRILEMAKYHFYHGPTIPHSG